MTTQKRTEADSRTRDVSVNVTLRPGYFRRWKSEFRTALSSPAAGSSWRQLKKAKCKPEDLAWALYNAVDCADTACDAFRQSEQFLQLKKSLIRNARRLNQDFHTWTELQFLGDPAWHVALACWTLKEIPPVLQIFPDFLAKFERIMTQLDLVVGASRTKAARAALGGGGEALVHAYVEEFTGKPFYKEISVLLESAAEAYGLEGREFTYEAVSHRHRRYLDRNSRDYADRVRWVREFRSVRRRNSRASFERFIVERTVAEGYPLVLEFLLKKAPKG